jgi:hypothetical protein
MAWIKISGPVSGVTEREDQAGFKYLTFRIGGRPVTSYIKMNVMERDQVSAVGPDVPEPQIEALRNDITKVEYVPQESPAKVPVVGTLVGVLLIPVLLSGLFILYMVWSGYFVGKESNARAREIKRVLNS